MSRFLNSSNLVSNRSLRDIFLSQNGKEKGGSGSTSSDLLMVRRTLIILYPTRQQLA